MDQKKALILEKATEVFLKFGIKSVTMDDMARELAMSKKTLYNHFQDKNDLVVQIIKLKTNNDRLECKTIIHEAENAIDELYHISAYVAEMMSHIHPSVFYDLRKFHPEASTILHNHKWKFVMEMILANIKRGKKEGLYRKELNEKVVAAIYVASTDLISESDIFSASQVQSDVIFNEIVQFQLHGMVNAQGLTYYEKRNKTNN